MACTGPRKGTEMMRGAGSIPAPLIAGPTMFTATFGSALVPEVAENAFKSFTFDVSTEAWPLMGTPSRSSDRIASRG